MPKLTKRLLESLEAGAEELFMWDSEVHGFGLRLQPTGASSFVLKYRVGARSRRFTIGKVGSPHTVETARTEARRLLSEIARGNDPLEAKAAHRAEMTVADLADSYLEDGPVWKPNKKASSWATDKIVLTRHIVPLLGSKLASRITSADVAQMQKDIATGKTAKMEKTRSRGLARVTGGRRVAALSIAVLSGAYSLAVSTQRLKFNPCLGVARLKSPSRERFLSAAEVGVLGEALAELEAEAHVNADMAAAIRLLMFTGARKSEITDLKWAFVDWDRKLLRLPDSKTGAKTIPLASPAIELLKRRPRVGPYVFPAAFGTGPTVGVPKAWRAVKARANEIALKWALEAKLPAEEAMNLADVRLHDLRHTFASFAVADGASLFVVGKVLGHKNARTTEVYAHLRDDPLIAVAEAAAGRVADALALPRRGAEVIVLPRSA